MEARQYRELLLIERINNANEGWFKHMHDRYMAMIYPEATQLPPKPPEPTGTQPMDAGDPSVKNMLTSYSQKLRMAKGYGGPGN